ncbi:MAG: VOC family protein [Nocardioidaceae bacterium]
MSIRRAMPDIRSNRLDESRHFYVDVLGFGLAMDMGWIITFVSPTNPTAQISVMRKDETAPMVPGVTVEVSDVDAVHADVVQRGFQIVHPLTDETWGVRRFFVRDPNGVVVNVMSHRAWGTNV